MPASTTFYKTNPWRFVWVSLLAYVVIGYFLFFAVSLLPIPDVFNDWIAYFATSIRSLDTAEKIALLQRDDPSAIQVLILYTAFGSIALTIWCLQRWLSSSHALAICMKSFYSVPDHKRPSKARVLLASASCVGTTIFGYFVFFHMEKTSIGWREVSYFSNTVLSVTTLLTFTSILALSIPVAVVSIYVAFSGLGAWVCSQQIKRGGLQDED